MKSICIQFLLNIISFVVGENCLFDSRSVCIYCSESFYPVDKFQAVDKLGYDCTPKEVPLHPNGEKTVLIAPFPTAVDFDRSNTKFKIYDNIRAAFVAEDQLSMKFLDDSQKINFKIMKGNHYLLASLWESSEFFLRNPVEVSIEPLYCNETEEFFGDLCFQVSEKAKIFIKHPSIQLFISKKMTVKNIIFDGSDIEIADLELPCIYEYKSCCTDEKNLESCNRNGVKIKFLGENNLKGLFNIEPVIGNNTLDGIPSLVIINSTFMSFYYMTENESMPRVLIRIYFPEGNCEISDSIFENLYFPQGIILKMENLRDAFSPLWGAISKIDKKGLRTTISLNNSRIRDYNKRSVYLVTANEPQANSMFASLFLLQNFVGFFTITKTQVLRNELQQGMFLLVLNNKNLSGSSTIRLEENEFDGNKFFLFCSLTDWYLRLSVEALFANNLVLFNEFNKFLQLMHIKQFYLNGKFVPPFRLPSSAFIMSSFSNLILSDCIFQNLQTQSPKYYLISLVSPYPYSIETVFTTAKRPKGLFFSNETTEVKNSLFVSCNFLFISVLKLNYILRLENNTIQNFELTFHGNNPFLFVIQEGLFSVKGLSVKNISSKSNFIFANPYLNASLVNLNLKSLSIDSSDVLRFFSSSLSDPSEHQFYMTNLNAENIAIHLAPEVYGKVFISLLYCNSQESGKGPSVFLTNSNFKNVAHSALSIKNHILKLDTCFLKIEMLRAEQISNSILLAHKPNTATTEFYLNNAYLLNSAGATLVRILDGGVSYYVRGVFTNSKFIAEDLRFNSAVGFNLAQSLFLQNLTFILSQSSGTLLYAQVTKLSTLLISDLSIFIMNGAGASLFTLQTESYENKINWNNFTEIIEKLEANSFPLIGIRNSSFLNARSVAIILLTQTQIAFMNCQFNNSVGKEGGVIILNQMSKAIFFNCSITKAFAETFGGAISIEGSSIIIVRSRIANSSSDIRGGVIYSVDSQIIISRTVLQTCKAMMGGVIFADNSFIRILDTLFSIGSAQKYGGHVVAKQGDLLIVNSTFVKGTAADVGGSLYLEAIRFDLLNTEFIQSEARVGSALYTVNGNESLTSTLKDVHFLQNFASQSASAIYSNDVNLNMKNINFFENYVDAGFLQIFSGTFFAPVIKLTSFQFKNNKAQRGLFHINDVDLQLIQGTFTGVELNSQVGLIETRFSKVFISAIYFLVSRKLNNPIPIKNSYSISSHNSNISLDTCSFNLQYSMGLLICEKCIEIKLSNSYFSKAISDLGGVLYLMSCKVTIATTVFSNNYASLGGVLYTVDSKALITFSSFNENRAKIEGSEIKCVDIIEKEENIYEISNSFFSNISQASIAVSSILLKINSCLFFGENESANQAIYLKNSPYLEVKLSHFQNFRKLPVILIENYGYKTTLFSVANSNFLQSDCPECFGGFIQTKGMVELFISSCNFSGGYAAKGGAIFFSCISHKCPINVSESYFFDNTATLTGGAILSESLLFSDFLTVYENNKAPVGSNTNFFPARLKIFVPKQTRMNITDMIYYINNGESEHCEPLTNKNLSIKPGRTFSIGFVVMDDKDNIQYQEGGEVAKMSIIKTKSDNDNNQLSNNIVFVEKGAAIFQEVIFVGKTKQTVSAKISYSNGKIRISANFSIYILGCDRGDSYQDGKCKKCPENFYSLHPHPENTDQNCLPCLENAYCPGGDLIIPNKYFWRKDENSTIILECKTKIGCPYQSDTWSNGKSNKFYCAKGYEDNLCQSCSPGYGLMSNQCVECTSNKIWFALLVIFGFTIYIVYLYLEENRDDSNDSEQDIPLVKILINHLSLFSILNALKINWSDTFNDAFSITSNYATTSPSTIFSYNCFFEWSPDDGISNTLLIAGVAPFIINIMAFFMNFLIKYCVCCKKNKKVIIAPKIFLSFKWLLSENMKHLTILFFDIYPQIFLQLLKVFGCIQIDNSDDLYLNKIPRIKCDSEFHVKIMLISIFFLLIWGLLFPSGLAFYLIHQRQTIKTLYQSKNKSKNRKFIKFDAFNKSDRGNREKLRDHIIDENKQVIINFLIAGYSQKFFWWEITIYFRKVAIMLIAVFSKSMDSVSLGGLTTLFLSGFLILTLYKNPYQSYQINLLEEISLLVSIISIIAGIIASFGESVSSILVALSLIGLIASNAVFFFLWGVFYFRSLAKRFFSTFSFSIMKSKFTRKWGKK